MITRQGQVLSLYIVVPLCVDFMRLCGSFKKLNLNKFAHE